MDKVEGERLRGMESGAGSAVNDPTAKGLLLARAQQMRLLANDLEAFASYLPDAMGQDPRANRVLRFLIEAATKK